MARGLLRSWRQKIRVGETGGVASSASPARGTNAGVRGGCSVDMSVVTDARVRQREQQVCDEIADDENDRCHQDRSHDEVLVLRENRVEREPAKTRPREDDLG